MEFRDQFHQQVQELKKEVDENRELYQRKFRKNAAKITQLKEENQRLEKNLQYQESITHSLAQQNNKRALKTSSSSSNLKQNMRHIKPSPSTASATRNISKPQSPLRNRHPTAQIGDVHKLSKEFVKNVPPKPRQKIKRL